MELKGVLKEYKKDFKKIRALNNVSLKIPSNSIFSLIGPNGAGKTTLLKLIVGIIKPDSGEIYLFGEKISKSAKKRLGFLPENPSFFKNISAEEFLSLSLKLTGKDNIKETIEKTLSLVGLYSERKEKIKNYSKGMRQRFGIAQAIVHDPEILILDEPFSGLDPLAKSKLKEIIIELHKRKKTILLSSHNLQDIEDLSTHIAFIKMGEIIFSLSKNDLEKYSTYEVEYQGNIVKWKNYKAQEYVGRRKIEIKNSQLLEEFINHLFLKKAKLFSLRLTLRKYFEKFYEQ